MRTQIEHLLLLTFQTLRSYTSSKVVEAGWMVLVRRRNVRTAKASESLWAQAKAEALAESQTPSWTAPEMDEVSQMRTRKMVDLMVEEMTQEREIAALKEQAVLTGSHLEQTAIIAA